MDISKEHDTIILVQVTSERGPLSVGKRCVVDLRFEIKAQGQLLETLLGKSCQVGLFVGWNPRIECASQFSIRFSLG